MTTKIKQFEMVSIKYNPIIIEDIPGISDIALDYATSIGGIDKPEDGATKNTGALADLDQVDTAQIVANAVTKVKMALLSVDADIIAASAITESKLYTGAVTADKIASNAITSAKISANAITAGKIAANAVTANEILVDDLSSINANIGAITAGTITGITLSGSTVYVNGDALRIRDTSSNQVGYVYGLGGVMRVIAATSSGGAGSVTMELDASSGTIYNRATRFHPYTDNTSYLGGSTTSSGGSLGSDKTWKYIGGQIIDAKDLYKLNDITVIDQSGTTIYVKSGGGGLVIQDGATTIATFSSSGGIDLAAGKEINGQFAHLDCIVLANNSPLNENGSMYSDGTNLYVRLGGTWRTVTTS